MKDAADAHGTRLPEHQARHQPVFNRITDDAQIGIELMGDAAFMDAIQGAVERDMGIGDGVVLPIAFALLALMVRLRPLSVGHVQGVAARRWPTRCRRRATRFCHADHRVRRPADHSDGRRRRRCDADARR
jgi:hypothetical protein